MHFLALILTLTLSLLTTLTTAAPTQDISIIAGVQIPSTVFTSPARSASEVAALGSGKYCGELPVFEGGFITPMYTADRCTNADGLEHFEAVHNANCGFCIVWSKRDCEDPIRWWGGPTGVPGQIINLVDGLITVDTPADKRGGQSYFCQ